MPLLRCQDQKHVNISDQSDFTCVPTGQCLKHMSLTGQKYMGDGKWTSGANRLAGAWSTSSRLDFQLILLVRKYFVSMFS
mmetsp:Transcript_8155/g.10267  ORF Transcript_8155/g.10267 Transcript_8155/m.10267 type:complete len:80 (-) Transcript_8155:403-642(-)